MADTPSPEVLDRQTQLLKQVNELVKEQAEHVSDATDEYDKLNQARDRAAQSLRESIALNDTLIRQEQMKMEVAGGASNEDRKKSAQTIADLRRINAELDQQIGKIGELQDRYKDFADKVRSKFGIKSFEESFLGKMEKMHKAGDIKGALLDLKKGMKDALSPANLGITLLSKFADNTKKVSVEQEILLAEFGRTTGAARKYDGEIRSLVRDTGALATGQAATARAYRDLFTGFTEFTLLTGEQRASIGRLTIALDGLGVSGVDSSQAMQTLMKSFGKSADASKQSLTGIANLARDIEVPPAQMIQDLNQTGPALAKFGQQADKVFRNMATASKQLGASVSELMGAMSQYDTFENAATAAGRLNSILGGPLINSVDLLNASEDERIKIMMQAVESSNTSWKSMNRFQRQAIANAAGITDMALANKMFSGTFDTYQRGLQEMNKYNQSQEALEKASQANLTLEMRRKQVAEAYAVSLAPLRQLMADILGFILEWNEAWGGWLIPVAGITIAVVMLVGKLAMFGAILGALLPAVSVTAPAVGGLGAMMAAAAPGVAAFGQASLKLIPILLTIAGVIAAIGFAAQGIGWLIGRGDDKDGETTKKAKRISEAARATAKLESGIKAITDMQEPLSVIETSIDHIVAKINTMNMGMMAVAGMTLAVAAPVAAMGAWTGKQGTGTDSSKMADKVAKAVKEAMDSYEIILDHRELGRFIDRREGV